MKRFFFSVIALATVAVGCTKSGLVDLPQSLQTPIAFEPYSGKAPITKANEANLTTLQGANVGIHVTGYLEGTGNTIPEGASHYMDKDVTYSNSKWGYTGAAYWPESGTLSFVAYGRNAGSAFAPTTENSKTDFTFTVPSNVAQQVDLLVSPRIKNQSISQPTVTVNLKHLLSRVSFAVQTNNLTTETGVKVLIKNVALRGVFVNKGTVDLTADHLVPTTTDDTDYLHITPSTADTDTVQRYSLFDSEYRKGTTGTANYNGFMTGNTMTKVEKKNENGDTERDDDGNPIMETVNNPVDIYSSIVFTPEDYPEFVSPVTATNHYMMIMPGEVGDLPTGVKPYIEVTYQLTDAEEQVAKVPLVKNGENWNFEAGKAYRFVFTVSTTAIGFTVEVDPWDELIDTTHTLTPEV